jgi:molybdopterin molybdotransferase
MLGFEEALERIVLDAPRTPTERVELSEAFDRVNAEDIVARAPLPPFDYSAMDGYALDSRALTGSAPYRLRVSSESRAGHHVPTLAQGEACRIFTGAAVPEHADAVVMQENVTAADGAITFSARPSPGENVRRRGEDLEVGAIGLAAGTRLGALQLGLVAALDYADVAVARRPRVTVVCTGDELRQPGSAPWPGSVPESNGVAVTALARRAGADARATPIVPDDEATIRSTLEAALDSSDLVVTVGGVSVGDHDLVRAALEGAGVGLDFWKVRIKPGKPLVYGTRGAVRVLGLPGNPASAQVTFVLFGLPLLAAMQGARDAHRLRRRRAKLGAALKQKTGRTGFYRAKVTDDVVVPLSNQASGAPTSLAWADALLVVPETTSELEPGASVEIIALT